MNTAIKSTANGMEKVLHYAEPRNIFVKKETLGLYKVVKGNKSNIREAIRAVDKHGVNGWIVNMADRQRKFYPDSEILVFPFTGKTDELKERKTTFHRTKKVTISADE